MKCVNNKGWLLKSEKTKCVEPIMLDRMQQFKLPHDMHFASDNTWPMVVQVGSPVESTTDGQRKANEATLVTLL